jgi:hypothetical protein
VTKVKAEVIFGKIKWEKGVSGEWTCMDVQDQEN